jgi:hypothetical protein
LGLPTNLASVEDQAKPAAAEAPKQAPKAAAAVQGRSAR